MFIKINNTLGFSNALLIFPTSSVKCSQKSNTMVDGGFLVVYIFLLVSCSSMGVKNVDELWITEFAEKMYFTFVEHVLGFR